MKKGKGKRKKEVFFGDFSMKGILGGGGGGEGGEEEVLSLSFSLSYQHLTPIILSTILVQRKI